MAPQLSCGWQHNITTQPKHGRFAMPIGSLSILSCQMSDVRCHLEADFECDFNTSVFWRIMYDNAQ
jgi:hypothetical protein